MAAATVSSPKTSPQLSERLVRGDDEAGPFVAAGDELEEHVGSFGLERIAMSVARRVLPVPGGPRNTTLPRNHAEFHQMHDLKRRDLRAWTDGVLRRVLPVWR
jgi:hypothetical protein